MKLDGYSLIKRLRGGLYDSKGVSPFPEAVTHELTVNEDIYLQVRYNDRS